MSPEAQVPPHNLDAEESLLGAILVGGAKTLERIELESSVKPTDFYRETHGELFRQALAMHAAGEPVDAITMLDHLQKKGLIEKTGGAGKLQELASMVAATTNAPHYARIVQEQAGFRRLIRAGDEIARLGWERPGDVPELLARAEGALAQAVAPTVTSQFTPMADGLDELVAEIQEAIDTGQPRFGLKSGFYDLDSKLTGLHPGQLVLIAARPGMGKSALAQNIAENVADNGGKAAIVTLEMSKKELRLRSLARACRIDSKKLRTGRLSEDEAARFHAGVAAVKMRDGLSIEDDATVTVQQLRAEARRLQRTQGLDVLVIDYLQLMLSGISGQESRQQEISSISRSLKLLARELEIPVIALSQLNRNLETRENKRPVLSDLRDSGSLEQDADVVLFIYRDEYYNPDCLDRGVAEVIVAKNRQGENGHVKLTFNGSLTEFGNLANGLTPLRSAA